MKFVIASDIHGSAYWTERLMEVIECERPDRVLLLGDLLYHGPRNDLPRDYAPKRVIELLNGLAATGRLIAVRGNCEAEVDQMVLAFPCMSDSAVVLDNDGIFLARASTTARIACHSSRQVRRCCSATRISR